MGSRPTVLLTGFGPFPGVPINASGELARKLARAARRAFPELCFTVAVLPTEWNRAPRIIANLHERHRPRLALHFGVASGAKTIRLETEAANICRAAPDAAGTLPLIATGGGWSCGTPIVDRCSGNSRGFERERLSLVHFETTPAAISAMPSSITHLRRRKREAILRGFVHIPQDLSEPPLDMTTVSAAALEIIKIALNAASAKTSLTLV